MKKAMNKNMLKTVSVAFVLLANLSVVSAEDSVSTTSTTEKKGKISKKISKRKPAASEAALISPAPATTAQIKSFIEPKLANRSISEYAFQAGENQKYLSVTPRYAKKDISFKSKTGNGSTSETENLVDLTYMKAMNSDWVGGISTSVGNSNLEEKGAKSAKSSGIADIKLGARKVVSSIEGQEFYGGFATLSPSEKEYAYDYDLGATKGSRTGNLMSGGHSLGGFYGSQKMDGDKIVGYKAIGQYYLMRKGNTKDRGQNIDIERTGGHRLGVETFAEFADKKPIYLGVKAGFSYLMPSDTSLQADKSSLSMDTKAAQVLNFGAYGRINMNEKVSFLPAIEFQKMLSATGGDLSVEGFEEFNLNVAARIAL